jgi:uncharacterized protein (DUF924 family)
LSTGHDPEGILHFWFGDAAETPAKAEARTALWFNASPEIDDRIREQFSTAVEAAARGELAAWTRAPRPALALVVVLDQFPRNIWRGTPQAFGCDAQALAAARQAVAARFLSGLEPIERAFLTLPFQHSESLDAQRESVRLWAEIVAAAPAEWRATLESFHSYAQRHFEVIARFGRFPHRNAMLGRTSTPEERAYLDTGGETFGPG